MRAWLIVCSFVMVTLVGSGVARADIAPSDACTSPGQPCLTAGPHFNQAGICTTTVCTKVVPAADGGLTTMRYNCDRCEISDAGVSTGTGGVTGTGTGGAGQATGGSPGTGGHIPNCCGPSVSCAVAPRDGHRDGLGDLALLALVGLTVLWRRRAGSTRHAAD